MNQVEAGHAQTASTVERARSLILFATKIYLAIETRIQPRERTGTEANKRRMLLAGYLPLMKNAPQRNSLRRAVTSSKLSRRHRGRGPARAHPRGRRRDADCR